MSRQAKDGQQGFFGPQHSRFHDMEFGWKWITVISSNDVPQFWLIRNRPTGIAGTVVWKNGHSIFFSPGADSSSSVSDKVFNHRRGKHFQKKIFVRLAFLPALPRLF